MDTGDVMTHHAPEKTREEQDSPPGYFYSNRIARAYLQGWRRLPTPSRRPLGSVWCSSVLCEGTPPRLRREASAGLSLQIREVVDEVVSSLRGKADEKELALKVDVPDGLPKVMVDRDWITQVVMNLVDNAVRHTPRGGEVAVTASVADGALVVSVRDTGISPEEQGHVFERFYRLDDSRVQETEGTGLGVAIVRSLVEMHGGQVWVQSELGEGSTFSAKGTGDTGRSRISRMDNGTDYLSHS